MNRCKICGTEISDKRIYCSNKCKFSDTDYNASRTPKIKNDDHYQLKCKLCGYITTDIHNLGGHCTTHLKKSHDIIGCEWHDYFDLAEVPVKPTWNCPMCDWTTPDILNKSGCVTNHLRKIHTLTITEFNDKFPSNAVAIRTLKIKEKKVKIPKQIAQRENKRNNSEVTCKICGLVTNTNGMFTHLTYTHKISTQEYIDLYGEYRPKYLNYNARSEVNDFKCLICNEKFASERHLSYHIIKCHKISKRDYIIKYILKGTIPKCKCGCGELVRIIERGNPPYWREYISGHNTQTTHLGMKRSPESKLLMRISSIERMKRGDAVFYRGKSLAEIAFADYIKSIYKGKIILNDTKLLSGLELDVYLPDLKLAFEFNGEYFHSDVFKRKNYHMKKTNECQSLGIRLVHIWTIDWNSQQDIIKSQILNFIGQTTTRIYARKCVVREVNKTTSCEFLRINHLQGNTISKYRYGLYYNDELVELITFGKLRDAVIHRQSIDNYELVRMCSKLDTIVVGGVSKLFTHFIKIHSPKQILTFAHRDWSNGGVYEKIGMTLKATTPPGYFYSNGTRKEYRHPGQKRELINMGFDASKSESDIMRERGYCVV